MFKYYFEHCIIKITITKTFHISHDWLDQWIQDLNSGFRFEVRVYQYALMYLKVMPWVKNCLFISCLQRNPCSRADVIYKFSRPILGLHYYNLTLLYHYLGGSREHTFKELMYVHHLTYQATIYCVFSNEILFQEPLCHGSWNLKLIDKCFLSLHYAQFI